MPIVIMSTERVYKYCLFEVIVKWPGSVHDARIFSNSLLNLLWHNHVITTYLKVIIENEPSVPLCLLGDPAYSFLLFIVSKISNGGKTPEERFFEYCLSPGMTEYAFGRFSARFGCLRRDIEKQPPEVFYRKRCS